MRSPSASASESRFSTITPHPSARTIPSARASNTLQRPSAEKSRIFEATIMPSGERITLTPPARARSLSPARRLWQARCTATSDDEHAVSVVRLGPRRSSQYEMRPLSRLSDDPVPV